MSNPDQFRVVSLFAGVGTFDHGFHNAGWRTVGLCEWDKQAREVLAARFPGVPITNDVTTTSGTEFGPAEVVMFGSPCQDLSVAGKRGGLAGSRSGLFGEALRFISEMQEATNGQYPRFAIWENVLGAFSSNGGRDFAHVLGSFLECGARDVAWRVLDSQHFGVPQRRQRIIVVADFRAERAAEVLALESGVRRSAKPRNTPRRVPSAAAPGSPDTELGLLIPTSDPARALLADVRHNASDETFILQNTTVGRSEHAGPQGKGYTAGGPSYTLDTTDPHAVAYTEGSFANYNEGVGTLRASGGTVGGGGETLVLSPTPAPVAFHAMQTPINSTTTAPCLSSGNPEGAGMVGVAFAVRGRDGGAVPEVHGEGDRTGVLRAAPGGSSRNYVAQVTQDTASTLTASYGAASPRGDGTDNLVIEATDPTPPAPRWIVRRLTPIECERLQGMPDNWTLVGNMPDSARYRFMGNGGTSYVFQEIAERMTTVLTAPA